MVDISIKTNSLLSTRFTQIVLCWRSSKKVILEVSMWIKNSSCNYSRLRKIRRTVKETLFFLCSTCLVYYVFTFFVLLLRNKIDAKRSRFHLEFNLFKIQPWRVVQATYTSKNLNYEHVICCFKITLDLAISLNKIKNNFKDVMISSSINEILNLVHISSSSNLEIIQRSLELVSTHDDKSTSLQNFR